MAENNVGADGAAPETKSKKTLIIIIAAVVLLLGGGAGAYFFLLSPSGDETATEEHAAPTGQMLYLDMSPAFIVSYPFQGRQRYLQASLSVMSRDQAALDAVVANMPIVRHNLLNLFSAQMLNVAETPSSGIEELRQLATEEVKAILHEEIGRDGIEEVIFTAFVTQ
ncbi:MAG: flagellar basal body-associated FliL family protein [Gammaproteobacteria bacterium]|nr:flagellar basal body-associated FliL family protein [Pseudomonadales bacterium]